MDTRSKIIDLPRALTMARSGAAVALVLGYFDVLTAAHARAAGELRRDGMKLMAAIADPPEPVLAARARAELAASLAAVDYVVIIGPADSETLSRAFPPGAITDLRGTDLERRRELVSHVHRRQAG